LTVKVLRRLVFDAGPFILLFTKEQGSERARKAVVQHERGQSEIFIHPNCLSEAYQVIARVKRERPHLLTRDIDPELVLRSAYATLRVVQDEKTTLNLGVLKSKYRGIPWGDLSSAALAMQLSDREKIPVIILDRERHFKEITEVESQPISGLKL